jgi:hypothetical protein
LKLRQRVVLWTNKRRRKKMASANKMKALFEQKMEDAAKVQTNTKRPTEKVWTPNQGDNGTGAHTSTGYRQQVVKKESNGPPPKRSLNDLP